MTEAFEQIQNSGTRLASILLNLFIPSVNDLTNTYFELNALERTFLRLLY